MKATGGKEKEEEEEEEKRQKRHCGDGDDALIAEYVSALTYGRSHRIYWKVRILTQCTSCLEVLLVLEIRAQL